MTTASQRAVRAPDTPTDTGGGAAADGGRDGSDDPVLGDYVAILRRRWILMTVVVLAVVMGAAFAIAQQPTRYVSSAVVLIEPLSQDPVNALGPPARLIDLATEQQLIVSELVIDEALGPVEPDLEHADVREVVDVSSPDDSRILEIAYSSGSAERAARGANALADAYIDFRAELGQEAIDRSASSVRDRLAALRADLRDVTATLAETIDEPESLRHLDAEAEAAVLQGQIALLSNDLTERLAVEVDPGTVIARARPPESPSSPRPTRSLAIAAAAGAVIAFGAALVRDRVDDRVRSPDQAAAALRARVLTVLPTSTTRRGRATTSRAYRRLAVSLGGADAGVVAVASWERSRRRTATAVGLATTLADAHRVLVVGDRQLVDDVTTHVDAAPTPHDAGGLGDGLTMWRFPTTAPDVIAVGPDAVAHSRFGGTRVLITSSLGAVGRHYDVVLIDSSPLGGSTDALELGDLVRGVVLVATVGVTRRRDLAQAADLLEPVGRPALGVVVHAAPRLWDRGRR